MQLFPPTKLGFIHQQASSTAEILTVLPFEGDLILICDQSPFHPVDHIWPDQPSDIGNLVIDDHVLTISKTVVVTQSTQDAHFEIDQAISAKRFDTEWNYFVGHIVSQHDVAKTNLNVGVDDLVGKTIQLNVDESYRAQLSLAHTACHLASLALNKAFAPYWKKDTEHDALGHPNFDATAIASSGIAPLLATDVYRLGKSLRKKAGFDTATALAHLDQVSVELNETLAQWLSTNANIEMTAEGDLLTSTKMWQCKLGDKLARIPCGGTHVTALTDFKSIKVSLNLNEQGDMLTMLSHAEPC